jgi:hypothetical protein
MFPADTPRVSVAGLPAVMMTVDVVSPRKESNEDQSTRSSTGVEAG